MSNQTRVKIYDEIVDFIAGGTTPQRVANFQPSEDTKRRIEELIEREKTVGISDSEKSELDIFMQLEHIMRLAKIRAHQNLNSQ